MVRASELLPGLRNYLDITWEEPQEDVKLSGIILTGMAYMQRLTSRGLDFEEGTAERALLFDYCRYRRAGALDSFYTDYQVELLTFRMDEAVKEAAAGPGDVDGGENGG